jgi:hypothetical protein
MRARIAAVLVVGALFTVAGSAPSSTAAPKWAPASSATIHPGVQMVTAGAQCTANFIFTRGADVLIGYAAHCAGLGAATDTNGCSTRSHPLGTKVTIQGATRPGTLVYSSWLTMQRTRERNQIVCENNDFALVRIDKADVRRVNPSVPHWGGPTGLGTRPLPASSRVFTYGSSSLRLGLTQLSPKTGVSLGTDSQGWSHLTYTATPGIPGDSGSGLLDASGRAAGVLSTIGLTPHPASNRFAALAPALYYAGVKGFGGVSLAKGTQAFTPGKLPVGV